jgi:pSer/pThr/pTyr-binding forkhead associated (FHA) protein
VLATLEIMNVGPLKGKKFELRGPLSHVGRGEHNDIILNDESVSDSHAKLQKREAGWFVVDMESTNGTYVGGRRLTGEQQLVGAPDVRFGGIKMIFRPAADALEEGKGTRAITGVTIEQAKARAAASKEVRTSAAAGGAEPVTAPSPSVAPHEPSSAPTPQPAGGIPGWIWVVLLAAVVIAAVLILKGR